VSSNDSFDSFSAADVALHRPSLMARFMQYEFARFLVVGTTASLANLISAWVYRWFLDGTPYFFEVSIVLGFSVGTVISFVLNKYVTFRATQGDTWPQFVRFMLVTGIYIVMSTFVAHYLLAGLSRLPWLSSHPDFTESTAHALTIIVMMMASYYLMKHFAFRKKNDSPAAMKPASETAQSSSDAAEPSTL
jgi:putative flippase GtrA